MGISAITLSVPAMGLDNKLQPRQIEQAKANQFAPAVVYPSLAKLQEDIGAGSSLAGGVAGVPRACLVPTRGEYGPKQWAFQLAAQGTTDTTLDESVYGVIADEAGVQVVKLFDWTGKVSAVQVPGLTGRNGSPVFYVDEATAPVEDTNVSSFLGRSLGFEGGDIAAAGGQPSTVIVYGTGPFTHFLRCPALGASSPATAVFPRHGAW